MRVRCFALLLFLLLAALAGCQSMQDMLGSAPKPTARVVGANIRGLSLDGAALMFDVEVSNPYPAKLPLVDLSYTLASAGTKLLEGKVQQNGSIAAKSTQIIQLPANIQFSTLLGTLKGVKDGAVVPYTANFAIGVDAPVMGPLSIPLSKSGEIPVPALPQVDLASFDIGKLALDQTTGTAVLHLKNPNQFPLDFSRLALNVSLGNQEVGRTSLAKPLSLQPGQTGTLQVPLAFSPRSIGASVLNLLRGNQIAYRLSGSIEANTRFGPIVFPVSRIGNTAVRH